MEHKVFCSPIEVKAEGEPGEFSAIFSRFNVIDKDGDLTLPGAFKEGAEVRIAYWGHRWQDLPVGRGTINSDDQVARVQGRFFLDTQAGKETYLTVKNLGNLAEWSFGYDILDFGFERRDGKDVRILKALEVPEVSPVLLGAGIGTMTEMIKSGARHSAADNDKLQAIHDASLALGAKCAETTGDAEKNSAADGMKAALPPHSTDTTDAAWDGPAMDTRCPSERAPLRATHAWVDSENDPDVKSSYKFIHHEVSADGAPGAANTRACSTGIGVLNGGRGGTVIPDADYQGVWNHLAKHLRDADLEPPELKSVDDHGQTGDGAPRNPPPSVFDEQLKILRWRYE